MKQAESKIKVKPRLTTNSGVPAVRTPVDFKGEEISLNRKGITNDINRTELVKKKHEAKYGSKKEKTENSNTKNKKKN